MTATATVTHLPVWNKNQTPGERLRELAEMADAKPHMYQRMVFMHSDGADEFNWNEYGNARLSDFLGLIELVKLHVVETTK
jgi:hypothetical protein